MCSTRPAGRTSVVSAAACAVAAGTFSNSNVTTRHAAGELADLVEIVVRPHDLDVGHLAGGRVGIRRIRVNAIAHPSRGDREHSPELAAPQHADGRTWKNRQAGGFVARHGFVRSVELGAAHLGGLLVAILV